MVSITKDVSLQMMMERRAQFIQWMENPNKTIIAKNRMMPLKFSQDDTVAISNFFFKEIMGVGAVSHVSSLIHYYANTPKGEADQGVGMRASVGWGHLSFGIYFLLCSIAPPVIGSWFDYCRLPFSGKGRGGKSWVLRPVGHV